MKKILIMLTVVLLLTACGLKDDFKLSISDKKVKSDDAWIINYTLKNNTKKEYTIASDFYLEKKNTSTNEWESSDVEISFFPVSISLGSKKSYTGEIHGDQIIPRLAVGTYRITKNIYDESSGEAIFIHSEEFVVE